MAPILSIIAPAHRTQYWMEFYNSVCKNDISFEIIFVSDKHPDFNMPRNFKYIYSKVKPAQCAEIALREAKGEIIHWTADDATYAPNTFDKAYSKYKSKNNYKAMICFDIYESGIHKSDHFLFLNTEITCPPNTIRVMPFGIMSRQLVNEIGRIDKRFIAGQWDNDLVMRAYSVGGKMFYYDEAIVYNDSGKHNRENNLKETHNFETHLLKSLWIKDGRLCLQRSSPLAPFSNTHLLTVSQSNKGKWK